MIKTPSNQWFKDERRIEMEIIFQLFSGWFFLGAGAGFLILGTWLIWRVITVG